MKDFVRVLLLLLAVFGGIAFFVYLGWILGSWGMAIFSLVVSVIIIMLVIRYFPLQK